MTSIAELATAWLAAEPDDDIRVELQALIDGDAEVLATRFSGRLMFGTAGLRAEVGAGPLRMNRIVVRQAAAGLADWLLSHVDDASQRGVVIGYDARRKSDLFALDTAYVLAARGIRSMVFSSVVPTPVLAWSITELGAASGVMVTASHNPPADNGYKVYLDSGAQIVNPIDEEIATYIADIDPLTVELAEPDSALVTMLDDELRQPAEWSAVDGLVGQLRAGFRKRKPTRLCRDARPNRWPDQRSQELDQWLHAGGLSGRGDECQRLNPDPRPEECPQHEPRAAASSDRQVEQVQQSPPE